MPQLKSSGHARRVPPPMPSLGGSRRSMPRLPTLPAPSPNLSAVRAPTLPAPAGTPRKALPPPTPQPKRLRASEAPTRQTPRVLASDDKTVARAADASSGAGKPAETETSRSAPTAETPAAQVPLESRRLRELKTGETLRVSDIATGEVAAVLAAETRVAPKIKRSLSMLDAKQLPMAPVRNEHYRALRALADELDAYLTEVERDQAWWREPRFVIVSEGEAVGVILEPRPNKRRPASRRPG